MEGPETEPSQSTDRSNAGCHAHPPARSRDVPGHQEEESEQQPDHVLRRRTEPESHEHPPPGRGRVASMSPTRGAGSVIWAPPEQ